MPGAGSGTLLFGIESSFKGSVKNTDYYHFGRNPTVDEISLERELQRLREAGVIEDVESVSQQIEGAVNVSATINGGVHDNVETVVFNDSGTGFTTGEATSAQVLVGAEYLDGGGTSTKLRDLKGAIPTQYQVSYNQGQPVRYSLNMLFADEADGSEPAAADITSPSSGQDAMFHSFDFSADSTSITKLQSCTLTLSNLYRYHRGNQMTPIAAVLAAPELTCTATAIWDDPTDQLEYAYGSSGATAPEDSMTGQSLTVDIDDKTGTDVTQYGLSGAKPNTESWSDVIESENDTTEEVEWFVANGSGGISVS